MTYCLLARGDQNNKGFFAAEKNVMIITFSKLLAHLEPSFKELYLIKLEDIGNSPPHNV